MGTLSCRIVKLSRLTANLHHLPGLTRTFHHLPGVTVGLPYIVRAATISRVRRQLCLDARRTSHNWPAAAKRGQRQNSMGETLSISFLPQTSILSLQARKTHSCNGLCGFQARIIAALQAWKPPLSKRVNVTILGCDADPKWRWLG
jgi:hypothetical protein